MQRSPSAFCEMPNSPRRKWFAHCPPPGAFLLRLVTAVLTKISEERKTEKIYLRKEVALSSFSFFLCRCIFKIAPPLPIQRGVARARFDFTWWSLLLDLLRCNNS